jgi:dTMP kinase
VSPAFIAFEGIDGSGKTTQARLLFERLHSIGIPIVLTREPSDGPYGQTIRQYLFEQKELSDQEWFELFHQDRLDHIQNIVQPALDQGIHVITDRYYLSSAVYQSDSSWSVDRIIEFSERRLPQPSLCILVDVDPRVAATRTTLRGSRDSFEQAEEKQSIYREKYLTVSRPWIERVDGNKNISILRDEIRLLVAEKLGI